MHVNMRVRYIDLIKVTESQDAVHGMYIVHMDSCVRPFHIRRRRCMIVIIVLVSFITTYNRHAHIHT